MNKLKNSKIILVLSVLLVFIVMGSASAVDETGDETVSTPETGVDTLSMGVDNVNNRVSAAESTNNLVANDTRNNDLLGLSNSELLSADIKSFSDLKNEITNDSSSITLSGNYYQYTSADGDNYAINVTNKIINGNGATIDGSNLSYPFVSSGYSTFKNINFINVKTTNSSYSANYQGGPIIFDVGSSNVIFDNCNFTKLTTTINAAGAIGLPKGNNITIKNCNFYDNTVYNTLIIFYNTNYVNENITIENCKFDNIFSNKSNGIFWSSSVKNFTMKDCEFTNNTPIGSLNYFGAGSSIINITNCKFKNSTRHALNFANADNVNITNCEFQSINHTINEGGGAILFSTGTNVTVSHCLFNNTQVLTSGNGGSIKFSHGYNTTVEYCNFTNIITATSGALNYGNPSSSNNVSHCNFINCTSGFAYNGYYRGNGGAIEFYTSNSVIDQCTFINNTVPIANGNQDGIGGAIVLYANANTVNITNSIFINNYASEYGGAIGSKSADCLYTLIENYTFINNTAGAGGAVYYNSQYTTMKNCNFTNNTAIGATNDNVTYPNLNYLPGLYNSYNPINAMGGAVYSHASGSVVDNCTFEGNSAQQGLEFYAADGCTIRFIGLKFTTLWLTNANSTNTIATAHGLRYDDPAAWEDTQDFMEFLDTDKGKVTLYLVGEITNLPEKILNIPNIEIVGYNPTLNPTAATINMDGWNHRAFNVQANNLVFTNLTFKNGNITGTDNPNGGVFYITGDNAKITNCIFSNNSAVNGSCIIMASGDILTVDNCTFNTNNASYGGAVFVNNCTNQSMITNSKFNNNVAYLGAGIYYNGTLWYTEEENKFNGNKITNPDQEMITRYTNIYNYLANKTYNTIFVKSGADGLGYLPDSPTSFAKGFDMVAPNGEIIFVENGETHTYPGISRTNGKFGITFTGNNTTLIGITFINSIQGYNVTITDFHFVNNDSCVIWQGRDGNIVNCTFTSKDESALILTGEANSVDITNSSFINNTNRALTIETHDVVLDNCTFKNNTVNTGSGSHILMTNNATNIIVKDSRFIEGNKTGILVNASNVEFSNSNFTDNTGENGGAIQQINGTLSLNGNIFEGNNATDNGGALNLVNGTSSLNDNNFTNNNANNGGAIYNNATLNIIDGVSFTGNNASNGGAIYNNATLNVNNAVFNGNNATLGGALYLNNSASIKDSSFEGNTAVNGSAIYLTKDNRLELDNVVLNDNTYTEPNDETYGSIYLNNPKNDVLTYTNLNLVGKNDIYDRTYHLNIIYISSNGSPTAWGRDPSEATTLDNAVKHILDNGKIIVTDDSGDFTINQTFNNLTNVTIVGNNKKFKTTDGKYLFNQPKNAKNKKKLCKNISFQLIIYPPI